MIIEVPDRGRPETTTTPSPMAGRLTGSLDDGAKGTDSASVGGAKDSVLRWSDFSTFAVRAAHFSSR